MKIVLAGLLESISSRADGSLKIVFGTQEIEPTQAGELFQLRGKYSKLLLSDTNIVPSEETAIEDAYIQDGKRRTKSGRLRAILFVVWNNTPDLKNNTSFENYYADEMEKLINNYKAQLEPATE